MKKVILILLLAMLVSGCNDVPQKTQPQKNQQFKPHIMQPQEKPKKTTLSKIHFVDPYELKIGKSYKLSQETPLMPEFEPSNTLSSIGQIRKIPANGVIYIIKKRMKRNSPWYYVEYENEKGWINSIALMGQANTMKEL